MAFKRLIIVTGSSRSIGRSIILALNQTYPTSVHFILIARDSVKLNQVKAKLIADSNNQNTASIIQVDFGETTQLADYFRLIKESLDGFSLTEFNELICVYNHGTLEYGSVSLVAQESLRNKFEINLFSVWNLLGAIDLLMPASVISKQFHVNITSGYAKEPAPFWSAMCCGNY